MKELARVGIVLALCAAAMTAARAQVQIDKHRSVPADPVVSIENGFGKITVTAWDKNEVWVKGTLSPVASGLGFEVGTQDEDGDLVGGDKHAKARRTAVEIRVDLPESRTFESDDDSDYRSVLEISVPRGATLDIRSVNAPVSSTGTTAPVSIESVNGAIGVTGGAGEIRLESLTGTVEYSGPAKELHVETVSGAVRVEMQTGEAAIRTVTGAVTARAKTFGELEVETTAGNVTVEGATGAEGAWKVETFSGSVALTLASGSGGHFRFRSAEGAITSNLGPKPRREERFNPFRVLEFRSGASEAEIDVETYSGPITLKTAGAGPV